jgi:WD40 repeat protein
VGGVFGKPEAGAAKLWEVASAKERCSLHGHTAPVLSVAFSPSGRTLATASRDQTARLWDVATGREILGFRGHTQDVEYVAFSPDGRTLATASWDATVKLWEVATGQERATLRGHACKVFCVAFSPDGRTLASAGGQRPPQDNQPGEIKLWDLAAQQELVGLPGHARPIYCVAFAPDGKTLASASWDATVKLWTVTLPRQAAAAGNPGNRELEALWGDLAGPDASKAYRSIGKLAAAGRQAVLFLQSHLRPAGPLDPHQLKQVHQEIARLDNDEFSVREKAMRALVELGSLAEPALRQTLGNKPSAEVRIRVEQLLAKLPGPLRSPELLQGLRAVEALEQLGTPEARHLLTGLSRGAAENRLTQEAKASLERLARRSAAKP